MEARVTTRKRAKAVPLLCIWCEKITSNNIGNECMNCWAKLCAKLDPHFDVEGNWLPPNNE